MKETFKNSMKVSTRAILFTIAKIYILQFNNDAFKQQDTLMHSF